MSSEVLCKDCKKEGVTTVRILARNKRTGALQPGPRCVTHFRVERKRLKVANHGRRVVKFYRIKPEHYAAVKESQDGKCYICQRSTGAAKALAVDHDHVLAELHDHPVDQGCPECIRALLCGPCNQMIGRFTVPMLLRAIEVLTLAPARRVLRKIMEAVNDDYEP